MLRHGVPSAKAENPVALLATLTQRLRAPVLFTETRRRHTWRDWLFSFKAFIAAMLALYIALAFDLSRPYWAVSAVYIVSSPFSGATKSKALYRCLGTILGAVAAVAFVPVFVNAPELLSLVVALWTGSLLFISMLDRSARSYVFMLAGYTLPLIALPAVSSPASVFDLALARTEEITLGILCASFVNTIFLPSSVGTIFRDQVDGWLADAGAWAEDILRGEGATPTTPLNRQKLATDVAALDQVISQLGYDPATRDVVREARDLRSRLLMLLPVFSGLADRLHALRQPYGEAGAQVPLPEDLRLLLNRAADWMKQGAASSKDEGAHDLLIEIERLGALHGRQTWYPLLLSGVLARLKEVVQLWQDCLTLRDTMGNPGQAGQFKPVFRERRIAAGARHYDHALLAIKAGTVVAGIFAACMIWIFLGWDQGAGFVAMCAVASSFFAAQDRPGPQIMSMLIWTGVAILTSFVYIFGILPMVNSYEMLVVVFAPIFLLLGLQMTNPALTTIAMLMAVNNASFIAIQDAYSADMLTFANSSLSTVLGVGFALVWVMATRPFGVELAARRLLMQGWRDLAATAAGRSMVDQDRLAARLLDRLGQLVPRLSTITTQDIQAVDGLADVRLGFNVLTLQEERGAFTPAGAARVDEVLSQIAGHYRQQVRAARPLPSPPSLLAAIDTALDALPLDGAPAQSQKAVNSLVGLRRVLFPHAAPPDALNAALPSSSLQPAAE
ncbi:FUSC family protein [Allorhizobium undicola]|uniref:FUSC family protein n=1 Tax=Allorhizobium undicola TaxID=78527 RepID=UPI003D338EA8